MIYESTTELIGNTPLLKLNRYAAGCSANIIAKLEAFNPGGSSKDRVAKYMVGKNVSAERLNEINNIVLQLEKSAMNLGSSVGDNKRDTGDV